MIAEKKKNSGKKVNPVDMGILLLILFGILTVGVLLMNRHRNMAEERTIRCVIRIPGVERSLLEAHNGELIPDGSSVRNAKGSAVLGKVLDVSVRDHGNAVWRNGKFTWEISPTFVDLEVTAELRVTPARNGGELRAGDLRIAAGGNGTFRFGNYYAAGAEILSVEVENDG